MEDIKVEKTGEKEYKLTYDMSNRGYVEYPPIGMTISYEGVEYKVKEVIAANTDDFTFTVVVE